MIQRVPAIRPILASALLLALAMALALPALAQARGTIHGTVTTTDGEPLPGALLFLTGTNIAEMKNAVTDEDGVFDFYNLGPGIYEIQTTMVGFATDISEVDIALDQTSEITITLEVSPQAE